MDSGKVMDGVLGGSRESVALLFALSVGRRDVDWVIRSEGEAVGPGPLFDSVWAGLAEAVLASVREGVGRSECVTESARERVADNRSEAVRVRR